MKKITFKHTANSGDLIASLAGIKKICNDREAKAVIYQRLNVPGVYYEGATHPVKNESGVEVMMNENMFIMIRELLISQDYIEDVFIWEGQKVDFDLDNIREHFVNMPYGSIQRWYFYVYPQMTCDLSIPWISVGNDDTYKDKILINRTHRYFNPKIAYYFLKEYDNLLFIGTNEEHLLFCKEWKLSIPKLDVNDFYELAVAINSCKFIICNQSMCYNIAEALKSPRILELCAFAPNCIPHGKDGYDFFHQPSLEYFIRKLSSIKCFVCNETANNSFIKEGEQYYQCSSCKSVFSKELNNSYMVGGTCEIERNNNNQLRLERLVSIGAKISSSILDYGCGNGLFIKYLKTLNYNCDGYDRYNSDYQIVIQKKYDYINMVEIIEHLTYPYNELDEVYDLLKNGGSLYIETSFVDMAEQDGIELKDFAYINPKIGHSTIFSHKGLDMLMESKGFVTGVHFNRNSRLYIKP
jgi:hypothetical protein